MAGGVDDGRSQASRGGPGLEPIEGRDPLSGLLVALHPAGVPHLNPSQVARTHRLGPPLRAASASWPNFGWRPGRDRLRPRAGTNTPNAGGGLYNGGNNPQGMTFPNTPLLGHGTPTTAELAREKFHARFYGPMATQPPRFSDQSRIIFMKGLGGSTPNFFLHGDYSPPSSSPPGSTPRTRPGPAASPSAPGYVAPVTGFAFLDDKNNNSGGVVGLDLVADPTSFDAQGRPTRLTFTADPNVYGGIFFVDSAVGTGEDHLSQEHGRGRLRRPDLHQRPDQPLRERDLYRRGGRLTARG